MWADDHVSDHTAGRSGDRLRVTLWLALKLVAALTLAAVLLSMAETTTELLVTAVLVPVVMIGLIGRHGLPGDRSRFPAVVQGLCAGVFVGVAAAMWVLDGWNWVFLAWLAPMTILFPAVVPRRLRGPLTATIEVDEEAIERTRWDDTRR